MNKISIIMELVMVVVTASALAVSSINAVSSTSQVDMAQNITCDLACQEAIVDEADSDDIMDRMMEECGFMNQYWCSNETFY